MLVMASCNCVQIEEKNRRHLQRVHCRVHCFKASSKRLFKFSAVHSIVQYRCAAQTCSSNVMSSAVLPVCTPQLFTLLNASPCNVVQRIVYHPDPP